MDFSQWLQAEMKRLDLTNYRLAKISGVHQTTISNILNGKKPQIETERKIKDAISEISSNLPEKKEKPALQMENGLNEIDAIFEQLTPSRRAKLLELARLYLDDQHRNEETQ